jgi:hypothetical protein
VLLKRHPNRVEVSCKSTARAPTYCGVHPSTLQVPLSGGRITFERVTSVVVLADADSVANWVSAISTFAAAIVALGIALWEVRRAAAERRDREAAQARLITVAVDYSDYDHPNDHEYAMARVVITNYSEKPVLRPDVESMCGAEPDVQWGRDVTAEDEDGKPSHPPAEVLMPDDHYIVPFEHLSDGQIIDPAEAVDEYTAIEGSDAEDKLRIIPTIAKAGKVKKRIEPTGVTITFTDVSGLRWRRTGNSEPVRVLQPTPGAE